MKKHALIVLLVVVVIVFIYKYFGNSGVFQNVISNTNQNTHVNRKYNFRFEIPPSSKLESAGNAFTCGYNECGDFSGKPGFRYFVFNNINNTTALEEEGDYYYSFLIQNNKVYRVLKVDTDGKVRKTFSDSELVEAKPYFTNTYGVNFYYRYVGKNDYCVFKEIKNEGHLEICFNDARTTNLDENRRKDKPSEELQKVIETFKFN